MFVVIGNSDNTYHLLKLPPWKPNEATSVEQHARMLGIWQGIYADNITRKIHRRGSQGSYSSLNIVIFTKEFVSHLVRGVWYRALHKIFKCETQNCTIKQSCFRCGYYSYILKARSSCMEAFVSVCPSVHKSLAFKTDPIVCRWQ